MAEDPETRASLLVRLRDPRNVEAWGQFVAIYAPLVYDFFRRKGLQDADAADVTQEVLRGVSSALGEWKYDPERGRFRSWLFTVVHNKIRDFYRRQTRHEQGSGDSAIQGLLEERPAPDEETQWSLDWERRTFAWAADHVRGRFSPKTWQAFWLSAVEHRTGHEVAAQLEMSVASVYLAKTRVMGRLRAQIQGLEMG